MKSKSREVSTIVDMYPTLSDPYHQPSLFSRAVRLLSRLLLWWLIPLVCAFFLSPVGPHLLWTYKYKEIYDQRVYLSCTYVGSRGFLPDRFYGDCPFIAWLDSQEAAH